MKVPYVDLKAQYLDHKKEILDSINSVMESGQYIMGPELKTFEDNFAKLSDTTHAIGVDNGTSALSLSMRVLGIGEGDEVITAPNSFFSSASSIIHTGAQPVFCDVKEDQNIDPQEIEKHITKKTKAIMPVHLTGKIADMNPILELAREKGIHVIEDAAQSAGALYHGKKSGSMGITGCFSLHPLKNLNGAGDGGIITTQDDSIAKKLRLIRNHGMIDRETIPSWGYNSRLDCLQASILNVKIKFLEEVNIKRRKNASLYRNLLKNIVQCPNDEDNCFDIYHLFVIQTDHRDQLQKFLKKFDIETSIHYPTPIHLFECCKRLGHKEGDFPKVEAQSKRILSLPIHQHLTQEQIEYTANKIIQFFS
ncbi:DegT/DnrJ/EryC1/StrS family aminotransferase [Bacteriovoracales bacterium]|nr:DegT/DnrJ/EryC1/StrS family aminotransferase [Bacteriovoracales bacterium]